MGFQQDEQFGIEKLNLLAELEESIVGCDGQAYIEPCPG
jgi:hypothetical protein